MRGNELDIYVQEMSKHKGGTATLLVLGLGMGMGGRGLELDCRKETQVKDLHFHFLYFLSYPFLNKKLLQTSLERR